MNLILKDKLIAAVRAIEELHRECEAEERRASRDCWSSASTMASHRRCRCSCFDAIDALREEFPMDHCQECFRCFAKEDLIYNESLPFCPECAQNEAKKNQNAIGSSNPTK